MASSSVTAIIVGWQARAHLPRCLASLERQRRPAEETIYVDNASADGSVEYVREHHPDVEVLALDSNRGFGAGNNEAIRRAETDLVALLNPDAEADPGWLEALVTAAESSAERVAGFASRVHRAHDPTLLESTGDTYSVVGTSLPRGFGEDPAAHLERCPVFGPAGSAALFRRRPLLDIGLFDEAFLAYYDDADLALRLNLAGYSCEYVPRATVRHWGQSSLGAESETLLYLAQRNLEWTYLKGMPLPLMLARLPERALFEALGAIQFAARGRLGLFLRAKAEALAGLPRVLRERRRVQATRRIGLGALQRRMERSWLLGRLGHEGVRRRIR